MIESRVGNMRVGLKDMIEYLGAQHDLSKLSLVEVGTYKGDSASMFREAFRYVTCVDAWEDAWFNVPETTAHAAELEFDRRMARWMNVAKIKGESVKVAQRFHPRSFDVVYIDASHDYTSVRADLMAWCDKALLWVCGHDFWPSKFPGVPRAVREVLGEPDRVFKDTSFVWRVR